MIYAYGICEPAVAARTLPGRGLSGAALRALEQGGLAAIYSRHRSLRVRPIRAVVFAHERVVEAIMARGTVLPLRFGTELEGEEQLEAVLTARRDELLRSLERVRGKVELGVRIVPERPTTRSRTADRSGRGYLLTRVRAHGSYEQAIRDVHAPLEAACQASRVRQPRRPPAILAASYLVESKRVPEFRRQAERLARRQAGMQVTVTGPWPPYSFATEDRE